MTIDLDYDAEQAALADTVRRWCEHQASDSGVDERDRQFHRPLWDGLAELGVLGLGTPEGGGGALEIAAAMEQLGAANIPGPLAATFIATHLLPPDDRVAVASGELVVSVGSPPLMPWAPVAAIFIEVNDEDAWRAHPRTAIEPVETLGGEPWGRVELGRDERLDGAPRALAVGDVALGAYLAGAGERLLRVATAYARDRVQFGRPIGDFQAVAHRLAEVHLRLTAGRHLVRLAAHAIDSGSADAVTEAATARLSATRAGLEAAYTAHQTLGAMGFTIEGPVAGVARRIRHVSLLPPGPSRAREVVLAGIT
jgi:alkylation response protein AidB-like acyl-CoA dehydrogenase